ncbi:LANO_0B07096g1_1 [Lachancea nothofagi CBS 11611]|uniref:Polyprenal reductase n=1 Tax=Lachancea nothofagi CBS 11611 TaxID=1266666 RepID=A0A1G4IZG6_9SACH|nr:LANO_0B07096g1_1 [Lachancea nothofagi CBS 11611]
MISFPDLLFYSTFLAGIGSIVVAKSHAPLLLKYGKTLQGVKIQRSDIFGRLQQLTVPKKWFRHFYVYSTFVSGFNLLHLRTFLAFLVFVHSTRRLYETFYINKFGPASRIHISHYLVGIWFYSAVNFTTFTNEKHASSLPLRLLAIFIFALASWDQYKNHSHLSELRKYNLPTYGLFKIVASPHYLDEIFIYFALTLYATSCKMLFCMLWVVVNLSISALETKTWYLQKFPQTTPRFAIIPYVI